MYLKFQRFSNNTWTDYGRVTLPLKLIDTMTDNTTAAMGITTYLKGADYSLAVLPPGEIVRLNFSTKIWYFVVIDSSEIDPHTLTQYKYHSYTVQELLCYFRETYIQTAFFTNGRYTLDAFLERLIVLSKCDYGVDISTADAYSTMLANWNSPDYQIASNALLDNLIKIGKSLQVRFKARINASNNIEIYAKKLKGNTVLSTLNGRKLSTVPQYKGANYAAKVVGNFENIAINNEAWFPADDQIRGMTISAEDGVSNTVTADKAVITLPLPIKKASIMRVIGFIQLDLDSATPEYGVDYQYYDINGNPINANPGKYVYLRRTIDYRSNSGIASEFPIVEYREWLLLDPDSTGGAPQHQQNTLYYKRGEDKIFNIKICNSIANNHPSYYLTVTGSMTMSPIYQYMIFQMNYYSPKVEFFFEGQIEYSKSNSKRATLYSQDSNLVSGNALSKNMQEHIGSMQNQDLQESWQFDSIDDVPEVGNIYNGMVISEIQLTIDNKINAVIQLSDELVPKSEYVSADGGLNLPAIPLDKSFDRFTHYGTQAWICKTEAEGIALINEYGLDSYFNKTSYAEFLLDFLKNGRNAPPVSPGESLIKLGNSSVDDVYTAVNTSIVPLDDSIIMVIKTIDNVLAGNMIDLTLGTDIDDFRFYPVNFVNSTGMARILAIKAIATTFRSIAANYPRISQSNYDGASAMFNIIDNDYLKDALEAININYQLRFRTYGDTGLISQSLVKESRLFKDTYSMADDYTRYVTFLGQGTDYTLGALTVTVLASGVCKIRVYFDDYSVMPSGSDVVAMFYRLSSTDDEHMLTSRATVGIDSGTNQRYLDLYVAFTK